MEKPILFSGPMVRAILDGRNTQTRRVSGKYLKGINNNPDDWACATHHKDGSFIFHGPRKVSEEWAQRAYPEGGGGKCPYGIPGDILWVRETWSQYFDELHNDDPYYQYRATQIAPNFIKWKPSIFMPRSASRITLKITGIRVERLQDISEPDIMQEAPPDFWNHPNGPEGAFIDLWDSTNKDRGFGWGINPWVWVISFKRITK